MPPGWPRTASTPRKRPTSSAFSSAPKRPAIGKRQVSSRRIESPCHPREQAQAEVNGDRLPGRRCTQAPPALYYDQQQRGRSMATIALVDDDKNILASVTMLLEQEGYHVRSYTDGASALTALSANPPDMAILDIKMPRMDGMELLRRLRQSHEIPVIFLTSKDEEIDELMGLNAGADDYIRKPFFAGQRGARAPSPRLRKPNRP